MFGLIQAFCRRIAPRTRRCILGFGLLSCVSTALDLLLMAGVFAFARILVETGPGHLLPSWLPVGTPSKAMIATVSAGLLLCLSVGKSLLQEWLMRLRRRILIPLIRGAIRSLFAQQSAAPYAEWPRRNMAKVTSLMIADVRQSLWSLLVPVLDLFPDVILGMATIVFLLILKPVITLLMALLVLCGAGIRIWHKRVLRPLSPRMPRIIVPDMMQLVNQALSAAKENRVMRRALFFRVRMRHISDEFAAAVNHEATIGALTRTWLESFLFFCLFAVTGTMLLLWPHDNDLIPSLALLSVVCWRLLPSIVRMLRAIDQGRPYVPIGRKLIASWRPVQTLRWPEDESPGKHLLFTHSIAFRDLACGFPGCPPLFTGLSGVIARGDSVAIIGASGVGKTTFIDTLTGLLPPLAGMITIDGRPLPEIRGAWQRLIGYVPQDPFIANISLRENVVWGLPPDRFPDDEIEKVLELVRLKEFLDSLPQWLDTRLGERGTRVSGGQRQRIAIARALLCRPEVLVLDEGTSQLDIMTEADVLARMKAAHPDLTLIIVTHRMQNAMRYPQLIDLGRYSPRFSVPPESREAAVSSRFFSA